MANRYAIKTGNWSDSTVWSATSGGAGGAGVPTSSDVVYLNANYTVTMTAAATCYIIYHTNGTLVTQANTLTVNHLESTGTTARQLNFSNGAVNISGNIMNSDAGLTLSGSNLTFTSTNSTINLTDGFGTLLAAGSYTFNIVTIFLSNGTSNYRITGSPTFGMLHVKSVNAAAHTLTLDNSAVINVQKLVLQGNGSSNKLTIIGNSDGVAGTQLNLTANGVSYGQFVYANGVLGNTFSSVPLYLGSNSTQSTGTYGTMNWLLQDPPKISTFVDDMKSAPSTNWTTPTYSGAAAPSQVTTGTSGGGYRYDSADGTMSKDTYDIVDDDFIYQIANKPSASSGKLVVSVGWLNGQKVDYGFGSTGLVIAAAVGINQDGYLDSSIQNTGAVIASTAPATPFYVKMRYDSSQSKMLFSISTNGYTWTNQTSIAVGEAAYFRSCRVLINIATYAGSPYGDIGSINPNFPPTVALNTLDLKKFSSPKPLVEFTGTDPEGNQVTYQVQIDYLNTFNSDGIKP